ncbi:MAG TPA: cohesin domain-containing protein [Chloroflexota bacterium]|nr:cohesin domain-containing protein [Chloroflexota bacterium]
MRLLGVALAAAMWVGGWSASPTLTSSAPPTTTGVALALSPPMASHIVGDVFSLALVLDGGGQDLDGVEAHLRFDPAKLQVADATGSPALSIASGSVFDLTLVNHVDSVAGQIDFVAGTLGAPGPGGVANLAVVTFKAINPTDTSGTTVSFATGGPRVTTRATWNGAEVSVSTSSGASIILY